MFQRKAFNLFLIVFLECFICLTRAKHISLFKAHGIVFTGPKAPLRFSNDLSTILRLRAGSDEDDSEYEDEDETDVEESQSDTEHPDSDSISSDGSIVGFISKSVIGMTKALVRATLAAFDFSNVEPDTSLTQQLAMMVRRMWNAAFSGSSSTLAPSTLPSATHDQRYNDSEEEEKSLSTSTKTSRFDFGSCLGDAYGVSAGRDDLEEAEPILAGSFQEALKEARKQARLLVALIPAHLPKKRDKADAAAVESFISLDVANIARKKAKKGSSTGSFLLWSAKATSSEGALAIKRLKAQTTNAKGQKRPILLVVYPTAKLVPRLLAQHHCCPPPSSETMAAWLNALRKRHLKQYATMQTELRELELFLERKEGYKESVKTDIEKKKKQEREEAERKAREEAERKRAEEIRKRREKLRENLPEEPENSDTSAYTIALRLADGRVAQRRFSADTALEYVFGWVDVQFEMEQETVVLTTMNGKISLTWEDRDTSLSESGLPKKAGLRVTTSAGKSSESD